MVKISSPASAPDSLFYRQSLQSIADDVRTALPEARHTLVYGSASSDDLAGDIDLAVIVEEEADRFDAMRKVAPILAQQIIAKGILTTCFPIGADAFAEQRSQFIRNVRSDGLPL